MLLGPRFQRMFDAALALVYPQACRVCDAPVESWRDGIACDACWTSLESAGRAIVRCLKCGVPLSPSIPVPRCGACDEFFFEEARACGPYRGALRESVLWLKQTPQLSPRAQEWLCAAFQELSAAPTIETIIPIPLHPVRARQRSFNQAEVLARTLARRTGLRVDLASLVRDRLTERHRVGLSARERRRSVENAFRVRAPRLIEDRAVLLIDDLMTTASTVDAAARTLRNAGARAVFVLTLARAIPEFGPGTIPRLPSPPAGE